MAYEIIPRESEEQWLEARRKYVTATDIGRLANGGPSTFAAVKAEKLGARGFTGNRYTDWGHEREPVILGHLEFLYGTLPNQDLYVNGGRAATPDGVGPDHLAEVKTTVKPWADVVELRRVKSIYFDQAQWALDVVEMERTWFGYEPHENFTPGPVQHFEILRDEDRLKELAIVEEQFLTYWDEEQDQGEWDEFMARYYEADALLKEAQAAVDTLKNEFREKAGDRELSADTPFGKISYSTPRPRATFDTTAFKKAHSDLAEQFTKLVPAKAPTLRITPKG